VEQPTTQPSPELERYTDSKVAEGKPCGAWLVNEIRVPTFPTAQPLDPAKEREFRS
jgi:hypothetical protein